MSGGASSPRKLNFMTLFNRGCLSLFAMLLLGPLLFFLTLGGGLALYQGTVPLLSTQVVSTTATIEHLSSSGWNRSCSLEYSFVAEGRPYRSTQVSYFDVAGSSEICHTVANLRRQGGQTTVRYLKGDPSRSFVIWGLPSLLLMILFPVPFCVFILGPIWTSPATRVG